MDVGVSQYVGEAVFDFYNFPGGYKSVLCMVVGITTDCAFFPVTYHMSNA